MNSKNFYYYLNSIVKRDLMNKYNYKNSNNIPRIKKIVLIIGGRVTELNTIAQCCLALEFLLGFNCFLNTSTKSDLGRKIRSGSPVGGGAVLKKKQIYAILAFLLFEATPDHRKFKKVQNHLSFSLSKHDIFEFEAFEFNQHIFKTLPGLKITLIFNKDLLKLEQELFKSL